MAIMRIPLVEQLCHTVNGTDPITRVPVSRGVWVPVVLSDHAKRLMLLPFADPVLPAFPGAKSPQVRLLGAQVCPQSGYEEGSK
jgi:hypothetical protein